MTGEWALLLLAGVGAGLAGSIAGLASLVSYPALLAFGLPPVAANVTNSTAMMALTAGAAAGSRPELRGQGRRITVLAAQMAVGGAAGAVLLLSTPHRVFAAVVPWLIAFGAVLLLVKDPLRRWVAARRPDDTSGSSAARLAWLIGVVLVGVYCGYFGAGSGIILLAMLSLRHHEPLPVTNAVKNLGGGVASAVATVAYLLVAPVDLNAAALLGAGALVGAWIGPSVVRRVPERPLQISIGCAGLGLAWWLARG